MTERWRALAVTLVLVVISTGCAGSSDGSGASTPVAEDDAIAAVDAAPAGNSDGYICSQGSIEFDTAIGWQVTGPDGTEIMVVENLVNSGSPYDTANNYTLASEPRVGLYTAFISEATIEITVVSGGPALAELFYFNAVDSDEFGEWVITHPLEETEVGEGATIEFNAAGACP